MYVRKCAVCGKRFPTSSRNKTICSEKCREHRKKEREKFAEKHKQKTVRKREEKVKICKQCGKEFTTVHNTQKYCSKECRRDANKTLPLGIREFVCEFCGNSFKAEAKRKFCCIECRQNAERLEKMRKKPKKPKVSIAKINELARKEGLNYGQYVAKYGV